MAAIGGPLQLLDLSAPVTSSPTLGQVLLQVLKDPSSATLRLFPQQWKTPRALAACRTSVWAGNSSSVRTASVRTSCGARNLAGTTKAGAADVTDKLLSGFIPQIRKVVSELAQTKPFQTLRSSVGDDQFMLKVFGAAYDCLPKPVRCFVSEQHFVTFCMRHRDQLVGGKTSNPGEPG